MLCDTSYREAKESFQDFLGAQGLSPDLLWVFREDVISWQKRFLIKVPIPSENERLAEACYEIGRERHLGICLNAFCLLGSRPCCYIQLPKDDDESQRMLMGNLSLKCSVRTDLIDAEPVKNILLWKTYRLIDRMKDTHLYVPHKLPYKNCFSWSAHNKSCLRTAG